MPMVPSAASFPVQPTVQTQQQPSPTIPNIGVRRSPPPGQVARLLPTPPHPNPASYPDDRRLSPPPGPQQSHSQPNVNSHYARPPLRAPTAGYPNKFQELESQMTPEFFADIDRAAEQQQAQYQSNQQPHSYPLPARSESPIPSKAPAVDRARAPGERSSPLNPENAQRGRREQLVARESPKTQSRQPASPIVQSFPQGQSHSPERRMSPVQHSPLVMAEPHPASYLAQYNAREAAAVPTLRRAPNGEARLNAPPIQSQPPAQTIAARAPDRSLPFQEEDEVGSKNGNGASGGSTWQMKEGIAEEAFHSPSPTPSSDLNPEGTAQRYEPNQVNSLQPSHPDEEKAIPKQHEDTHPKYPERDSTEEEGGYTPRSPTAGLPEDNREMHFAGQNIPVRVPVPVNHRAKARNGTTEHLMRGLETTLLEQQQQQQKTSAAPPQQPVQASSERPPQYVDHRHQQPIQVNTNTNGHQYQNYSHVQEYGLNGQDHASQQSRGDERYISPQVYPDDFHSYGEDSTSAYIQSYLGSPRPDAPIPPTPHSQTAAPSPSPYLPYNPKDMPASSRHFHAGSPYLTHLVTSAPSQMVSTLTISVRRSPGSGKCMLKITRATSLTRRSRRDRRRSRTISCSPVPAISLSLFPCRISRPGRRRRMEYETGAYSKAPSRRVESTQPRDTSPELSSSGEETAGEDKGYSVIKEDILVPDPLPFAVVDTPATTVDGGDDEGDWVDEEDEDDLDDLINLEYHPDFIKNVSKRRRKWEVGWENLIQAFQALDRQTDATMILLASPSHTTKLHALKSRSIRRQTLLSNSIDMSHIRSGFAHIAAGRRTSRTHKPSFLDGLPRYTNGGGGTGDGSDGSSASGSANAAAHVDVRRALDAVRALSERREARLLDVLQQSNRDQERIELLLRNALADKNNLSNGSPRLAS
ncbi:hypothetical protein CPB84DRAFT_1771192 [Gymnopilus junonius]|uniref:Uncharacterized protein n=1 Tax=Gymnopilus junonius TaxID=109634 RepID=A0A9P5NW00_GYMJU|nr:hypothetical protein CPB84DRAFT_1771192 [Gymnopilus junonius]